ncbi:hypothetical protein LCGC14_2933280, partial [marine sediment metagenome]
MGGIDSNTKLMLHCNGSDGSATFTDSGNTVHTMTAQGNAQLDTAQKKFGTASGLFDGTGDYVSASDHADWDFGSSDFTIDFQARHNTWADANYRIVGQYSFGNSNSGWTAWINGGASQNISFHYTTDGSSDNALFVSASMTTNTWYHIAIVRNGANLMFFLNGTQQGSTQDISTSTIYNSTRDLEAGGDSVVNSLYYDGWIDELRISSTARWTTNFTPPTSEYSTATAHVDTVTDTVSLIPSAIHTL